MSVLVDYAGRLGNNILQYCMASYLSYKFDLSLNKSLDLNDDFEINQKEGGRSLENHIEVNDDNLQEILARKSIDSGIRVKGWFSSRYVFENEEIISYYKKCIVPKKIDNTSDLFVHVRLGDIDKKFNLPYTYYEDQISKINYNDCFLTSDSIDHPIVKDLQKRFKNIQLSIGWSPSFTIRYGANCDKLVLSSGTFSLCMALFNRGTPNVYCIDNYSMEKYFKIKQWDGGGFYAFIGKSNFNFYNESKA